MENMTSETSTDFDQRCCQCGRTESWAFTGLPDEKQCACGHLACMYCEPLEKP